MIQRVLGCILEALPPPNLALRVRHLRVGIEGAMQDVTHQPPEGLKRPWRRLEQFSSIDRLGNWAITLKTAQATV